MRINRIVIRYLFTTTILLALVTGAACAQDVPIAPKKPVAAKQEGPKAEASSSPRLPPDPNKFAVVISGIGGDEAFSTRFAKWAGDLRSALVERLGFAEERVTARKVVVVNMASASGEFIKPLSGAGRVVITATRSGQEQYAPRFAEHFIAALGNPEADADKNGRVSAFEAFTYATKLTGDYYEKKGLMATEHALLDDNGDGVGHAKADEGDGALARTTYFDSLPLQQAGGDEELAKLFSERLRLEGEIERLKARKAQMNEDEYDAALEKLLIEFAKVDQSIKAKRK
jgi:hypothetical protein